VLLLTLSWECWVLRVKQAEVGVELPVGAGTIIEEAEVEIVGAGEEVALEIGTADEGAEVGIGDVLEVANVGGGVEVDAGPEARKGAGQGPEIEKGKRIRVKMLNMRRKK